MWRLIRKLTPIWSLFLLTNHNHVPRLLRNPSVMRQYTRNYNRSTIWTSKSHEHTWKWVSMFTVMNRRCEATRHSDTTDSSWHDRCPNRRRCYMCPSVVQQGVSPRLLWIFRAYTVHLWHGFFDPEICKFCSCYPQSLHRTIIQVPKKSM